MGAARFIRTTPPTPQPRSPPARGWGSRGIFLGKNNYYNMSKQSKFTGRVYHFKNGETHKEYGYESIDPYLFSKFDDVVKIDLVIEGEKVETLKL